MIDRERIKNFLIELIKIDSLSRQELNVALRLKRELEELGAAVSIDDAGEKVGGNVGNLIAKFPGNAPKSQPLLLSAHMDTVVPGEGIVPILDGDILRTNGKTVLGGDDKSGVAIICEVLRVIKENSLPCCPIDVVFTICEEAGLIGAKWLDVQSPQRTHGPRARQRFGGLSFHQSTGVQPYGISRTRSRSPRRHLAGKRHQRDQSRSRRYRAYAVGPHR